MTPEIHTNILLMCEFIIKQAGIQGYKIVHDTLAYLEPLSKTDEMKKNHGIIKEMLDKQILFMKDIVEYSSVKAIEEVKAKPKPKKKVVAK